MSVLPGGAGEAPASDRAATKLDRVVLGLTLAAALGVVLVVFHVDYLPTGDGPHHVFAGYLENHFDDPGAGWHAWLARGKPRTALGFHLLFSACERLLPWRRAFQVSLALLGLGWGAGYLALVRALHPRRAALGLLGFATSISWAVYQGFFAFALSIAVGFGILAIAAGAWPWSPARRALLAALLAAQAVVHAFGASLTGVVVVLMVAVAARGFRARAKELALVALMGAPALAIAATAGNKASIPTAWLSIADHFTVLPRTFLPGPLWRAWTPLLLGTLGVVLAVRRLLRGAATRAEIALAGAAALHLAAGFAAPIDLPAWELFAPRFLPFGCLLGAALLPLERLDERRRAAAALALSIFAAASLVWAARTAASLRARDDEAMAGLSAPIRRTGPRLAVSIDAIAAQRDSAHTEIPYFAPIFTLGALYAIEQGGIPPCCLMDNPRLHPFVLSPAAAPRFPVFFNPADFLDPRIQTDPAVRAERATLLAMVGTHYEDVIIHGRPEDGDLFVARGYATDFRRDGLFIGHIEGCPTTVRVVTPAPRNAPVFVDWGADPLPRILFHAKLPPAPTAGGPEAIAETRIARSLCGPMWLRVALDRDGSGSASKADAFCEGADAKGRLHVAPRDRAGQTIECRIAP